DVLRALGEADERHDALRLLGDLRERLLRGLQEVLLEQQVLRRIPRERELGEEHELRAGVARGGYALADDARVALEVADAGVDLREREAQRGKRTGHGLHRARPPGAETLRPRARRRRR